MRCRSGLRLLSGNRVSCTDLGNAARHSWVQLRLLSLGKISPSPRFSSSSTAPSRSASCSSLSSSAASSRRSLLKISMEAIVKSRWLREPLAKTPFEWLCVAAYRRSIKLDNWLRQLWDRLWIPRLLTDFAVRPGGDRLSFRTPRPTIFGSSTRFQLGWTHRLMSSTSPEVGRLNQPEFRRHSFVALRLALFELCR